MPPVRLLARILVLLAVSGLALAGCDLQSQSPTAAPTAAPSATPTAARPATQAASPPPTLTPTATPTPAYPAFNPVDELSAEDLLTRPEAFHGVIAFTTLSAMPWLGGWPELESMPETWQVTRTGEGIYPYLWVFSIDGTRAGMISPQYYPARIFHPQGDGKPLVVQNGFSWHDEAFEAVPLPGECLPRPDGSSFQQCDGFSFSADGRYLAFRHGDDNCGRSLILLDRQTGERLIDDADGRNHGIEFLPNGQVLIASGHCEGGGVALYDPATRDLPGKSGRYLGGEGLRNDRPDGGVLVSAVYNYTGPGSSIWAYNLNNSLLFTPSGNVAGRVRWAPDGRHFVYHYRYYQFQDNGLIAINSANAVAVVDSETGRERLLAADPAYDYHLCHDANGPCDEWRGDWIRISRNVFHTQQASVDEWFSHPCLELGYGCEAPAEYFALNWRTGELTPWEESALPSASPPTPYPTPGPDTNQAPVYTDPEREFAFYTDSRGRSLWLVPRAGTPVRWVWEGRDFFYIP